MTKLKMAIAALGVATTIWGSPLLNAGEAGKDGGQGWGKGRGEHMKKELGLSDDQAEKFKAAQKAQMDAMKPLQEKQKLDIDSLRVLVDKKAADKDLSAAIAAIKADHQAIEEQQKKHREAMAQLLTPLQQAKAVLMMGDMGERWAGKMGHGKGMGKGWHKGGHDDDDDKDEEHEHKDGGKY